jgi:hypothetical protein
MVSLRSACLGLLAVLLAIPSAAQPSAADPLPRSGRCDLRAVDWGNFTYPDFVLKNGKTAKSPDENGFVTELQTKEIAYGDLRGDGSLAAFVPVYSGGPADHDEPIFVYEMGPGCVPRLALKTGGLDATPGQVTAHAYGFKRLDTNLRERKFAVRWTGDRFAEAEVPYPPLPPETAPLPRICDLHKVDWYNFAFPGFVALRDSGGADRNAQPGQANCWYQSVDYGDLDGNGAPEAYLGIQCSTPGPSPQSYFRAAVLEQTPGCGVRSLGILDGGGDGTGTVNGQTYVIATTFPKPDGSQGQKQWTYRRAGGRWTFTTETPR